MPHIAQEIVRNYKHDILIHKLLYLDVGTEMFYIQYNGVDKYQLYLIKNKFS